jgi:hypothetical protein
MGLIPPAPDDADEWVTTEEPKSDFGKAYIPRLLVEHGACVVATGDRVNADVIRSQERTDEAVGTCKEDCHP